MTYLEMAKERYSVRRFNTSKPVEQQKLDRILEAARLSPSAHNFQSFRGLVINSKDTLENLKACTPCHYNAPLAIVVGYDSEVCWKRESDLESAGEIDAVIAGTQMLYAAFEEGIGVTWVMQFNKQALRDTFKIPANIIPVAILVMGYASDECRPSSRHGDRKDIGELVTYNSYQ